MSTGASDAVDEHWLDGWVGRGRAPGGSGAVHVVVTGLPDGAGSWHVRVDDGVVAEVAVGAPPNPDLTLTFPAALASEVASRTSTASAAFMQGRMKTAGDLGLVLDVLAAVDSRR
ncbi:MAG TPA: SCP2 sterol-binding domain-containing protein [Acidimicrobiia bacterium]|nr:SCP2 sterol-binding domain-containing protein [Acidimicrobiia bacterium]